MSNVVPLPLPALRNMSTDQLLRLVGTDPRKWAQAFLEIYEGDPGDGALNEDWVAVWFSRAMEAAREQLKRDS